MKYVVYAIVLALSVPLYSQEIRLDSLWIKMGGYPVMAFSPDSKVLVLGSEILEPVKGAIRFFEVETGKQLDSITKISFIDFGFSPSDGNLYIVTTTSIDVYDKQRMLVRRMPYTKGGLLSFSPDGSLLLMTGEGKIRLVKSENAEVVREITRPSSYKGSNNQDIPFNNGRVNFNSDGTLLYGKNAEDFGSWDLTKTDAPFVRKMTIGNRAVIGFTPDNRYMIQQSNYIWDLSTKSQVQIEGLEAKELGGPGTYCHTPKGKVIFVTKLLPPTNMPQFSLVAVNIEEKRILSTENLLYPYGVIISPDSSYLSYNYGNGQNRVYKLDWKTTGILENQEKNTIKIVPSPSSSEIMILELYCESGYSEADISIVTIEGTTVGQIFKGELTSGHHTFSLRTTSLPSGMYYVVLSWNQKREIYPFIINK
jgi:hypothetical protein